MPRGDCRPPEKNTINGSEAGCLGDVLQQIPGQQQFSGPIQARTPLLQESSLLLHLKVQSTGNAINRLAVGNKKIVGLDVRGTKSRLLKRGTGSKVAGSWS